MCVYRYISYVLQKSWATWWSSWWCPYESWRPPVVNNIHTCTHVSLMNYTHAPAHFFPSPAATCMQKHQMAGRQSSSWHTHKHTHTHTHTHKHKHNTHTHTHRVTEGVPMNSSLSLSHTHMHQHSAKNFKRTHSIVRDHILWGVHTKEVFVSTFYGKRTHSIVREHIL